MAANGRRAVVYCASTFEFRVIIRLRRELAQRGWPLVLITHRLSIAVLARRQNLTCILLRPASGASPFAASLEAALDRARTGATMAVLVQWNGQRAYGQAATAMARARGMGALYLELGNIAPRLFADPWGVNGAAWLAHHPEVLDGLPVSDPEIEAWIAATLASRRVSQTPQTFTASRINPWFAVDYLGAVLLRIPQPAPLAPLARIIDKLGAWIRPPQPPPVLPDQPYLFFPMQVHDEPAPGQPARQIDRDAITAAAAEARARGLQLVIKPHPVETDAHLLDDIAAAAARDGHLLTSANATVLVAGSEAVVTINSSVGLEALLMDKPLILLGEALFASFDRRRAAVFCMAWLIDFQPFADQDISSAAADRLAGMLEDAS